VLEPSTEAVIFIVNDFVGPDGKLVRDDWVSVHVRRRIAGAQAVYTLTLINEAPDGQKLKGERDDPCLFQSELVVAAAASNHGGIRPRPRQPVSNTDEDAGSNALLYRDVYEYATGHGIAAVWGEEREGAVQEVRTAWLPSVEVKGTSAKGSRFLEPVQTEHARLLSASFLGEEGERAAIVEALQAFANCYGVWIEQVLDARLADFSGTEHTAAAANLQRCNATLRRINAGIDTLRTNADAFTAFALSNRAMNRQSMFPSKGTKAGALTWRPFQLAFFLLVIPGLVDPANDDRACMDLLWFPTGGGKTEAYLALTAFQIFYQRLTQSDRRDIGGVDVIMRYTLRLLTVQQFQRAAALIVACELIRQQGTRLGTARITLGLYVGGEATPNKMDAARLALQEEQLGNAPKSTPRQLLRCPVCGGDLLSSNYRANEAGPEIDIVCVNTQCEVLASHCRF
jgi:hypothetical protein